MNDIISQIENAPVERQRELLALASKIQEKEQVEAARSSFLAFVKWMMPTFVNGKHHQRMAKEFDDILADKNDRLLITLGPRHSKSILTSIYLIAFYFGHHPEHFVIQATHNADLAQDFGRDVRNMVATERYRKVFPGTILQPDTKAAGRWNTTKGGKYFALGAGSKIAGKGAHLLVLDDVHALTLDTEVPTPEGFKTVENVAVGDYVFGPDGKPTKVTGKSAVAHDREIYKVTTSDDQDIFCDGGHLWAHRSHSTRKSRVDVSQACDLAAWCKPRGPYIPNHSPVEYQEKPLPIDPYVLGAWLGDGSSSLGRMTAAEKDIGFMREQFEGAGYETTTLTASTSFGVMGLRRQLIDLGLLNNKHIPEQYLTASVAQRKALVQGLVDTDGHVSKDGFVCFDNTNLRIALGFRELLHSLGVKANGTAHSPRDYQWSEGTQKAMYRVNFVMANAARMPRKKERLREPQCSWARSISVRPAGFRSSVQCISVERQDGLFLVGRGYVVTHNSEQDYIRSLGGDTSSFDDVVEWYQTGPRQRLQPGAKICVVGTRWHVRDLMGRLIKRMTSNPKADQWRIIEFPAILPSGKPLWPEFWSLDELERTKAELSSQQWEAQYQQNPVSEISSIIKRDWWRIWPHDEPPKCEYVIQSWDTAYLKPDNRAAKRKKPDYSARTDWGIFYADNEEGVREPNIILLDAWKKQIEFPQLKSRAKKDYDKVKPDVLLVEAKASGIPLVQELRMAGVPAVDVGQARGSRANPNDKISRVHNIADIFKQGKVWRPERKFAEEVAEECAAFPAGDFDDYVDTTTQALNRFRQGGFITLKTDEDDEDWFPKRKADYY